MTSCSSLQNRDFDDDDDDLNVDDGPGKHSLTVIFSLIGDTVICINAAKEKKWTLLDSIWPAVRGINIFSLISNCCLIQ